MATRRNFLKTAMATLTLPLSIKAKLALGDTTQSIQPDHIIFDARIRESCDFADKAKDRGASVRCISRDISDIWYRELAPRLNAGSTVIAGLTDEISMFILHRFALTRGLDIVYRGEHVYLPSGGLKHSICTSARSVNNFKNLADCGQYWGREIARIVTQTDVFGNNQFTYAVNTRHDKPIGSPRQLVSWVFAPRIFSAQFSDHSV